MSHAEGQSSDHQSLRICRARRLAGIADRYIDALIQRIAGLAEFPRRGTSRDDLRVGLRTVPFRRRLTIAYAVKNGEVRIIAVARAGQDMKGLLAGD